MDPFMVGFVSELEKNGYWMFNETVAKIPKLMKNVHIVDTAKVLQKARSAAMGRGWKIMAGELSSKGAFNTPELATDALRVVRT